MSASAVTDADADKAEPMAPMNVVKPETVRHLCEVDVGMLQQLIARASETLWAKEDAVKENNFPCFHHTQHIVFRFIENNQDRNVYVSHEAWTVWASVLEPIMHQAVAPFGFRKPVFPKAMLARLAAGHVIDAHRDGAGSNLTTHKIHVPLQTNPDAVFFVGGESFHLETGHAYEVNNIRRHGARNGGQEDRVHFIFEVFDEAEENAG